MKSFRYIALAALTLSFAACTQEDDFTPQGDSDAVKINATIGAMQTRVAYDANGATTFTKGDAFKVVNTMRSTKNEATYTTTDGTNWTTADAFVWNGGTATNQFQAWYPATASYNSFTLPTDQSAGIEAADWMTASTDEIPKPADGVLTLAFQHRLAKVTVQITEFTSQFDEDAYLKDAIIHSLNNDDVTVNEGIKPVLGGDAATAIICPGKYAAGTYLMEIIISDTGHGDTKLNVPVNAFLTDTGLEAGNHYKLSLKAGKDVVVISEITVNDWTQTDIDGGVAEELEWRNGINIYTGEYERAGQNAEGEYEVANAGNLMWMSQQISAGALDIPYTIKLVDDITIGEDIEWVPIAHPRGTQYSSVFDGNGHTLTINQDRPEATYANFGLFKSFDYSTVKNLTIKGNISLNTDGAVGAIAATAYRTTISGVISYANITNRLDDGVVGGLVGQFGGQHSESDNQYSLIENCAVYADVSGWTAGGIIGYGWSGVEYYDIKNTAFYGDVTGQYEQGAIIGHHGNNQTAPSCTFKHIYYYEKDDLGFSGGGTTNYTLGTDVAAKTIVEFASPQMAELLNADQTNGPWEYLSENDYPTLKK